MAEASSKGKGAARRSHSPSSSEASDGGPFDAINEWLNHLNVFLAQMAEHKINGTLPDKAEIEKLAKFLEATQARVQPRGIVHPDPLNEKLDVPDQPLDFTEPFYVHWGLFVKVDELRSLLKDLREKVPEARDLLPAFFKYETLITPKTLKKLEHILIEVFQDESFGLGIDAAWNVLMQPQNLWTWPSIEAELGDAKVLTGNNLGKVTFEVFAGRTNPGDQVKLVDTFSMDVTDKNAKSDLRKVLGASSGVEDEEKIRAVCQKYPWKQ